MSEFLHILAKKTAPVQSFLEGLFTQKALSGENHPPLQLLKAIRSAVLTGGKRIRPFLVLETASLFTKRQDSSALYIAAALECIHCYSLIHDDLPAMDDAPLRRGHPTIHVAFDEATAILAGDALLTYAFELLTSPQLSLCPEKKMFLVHKLAQASGVSGMVGGQMLDMEAERGPFSIANILTLHAMKTGALFRFSCEAGAVLGDASVEQQIQLARFGATIGLAFQLKDDLLDATGNAKILGKINLKDVERHKSTLINHLGIKGAESQLNQLIKEAHNDLKPFGSAADTLHLLVDFIAQRDH